MRKSLRVMVRSPNLTPSSTFFIICALLALSAIAAARDYITVDDPIRDLNGETLISAGSIFQFGFFRLYGDLGDYFTFVGIWYYGRPPLYVWVANRDQPLFDSTGFVTIDGGNLKVMNESQSPFFSTNLTTSSSSGRKVQLMDSGNLVLIDDKSVKFLWQSFNNPTDTFLPGMKLVETLKLTSWRSPTDPRPGNFSFYVDQEGQMLIKNRTKIFWRRGKSSSFNGNEDYNQMPLAVTQLLSNSSNRSSEPVKSRLVISSRGKIEYFESEIGPSKWQEPQGKCDEYNACGNFGVCNSENLVPCKCLPGFVPSSPDNWKNEDFSSGCVKKTDMCSNSANYTFLDLKMMKVESPSPDSKFDEVTDEEGCRKECMNDCQCKAYSHKSSGNGPRGQTNSSSECWIWTSDDLKNLQENVLEGGQDLSVRVAIADIEATERDCKPCGTNLIPYPLSTGPACGDSIYNNFRCNSTTGQVEFLELGGSTYQITNIDPENLTLVMFRRIVNQTAETCKETNLRDQDFNIYISGPYRVISSSSGSCYVYGSSSVYNLEVVVHWFPPPEPTCSTSNDCNDWPNSNCEVNKKDGKQSCICKANYSWDGLKCAGRDLGSNPRQSAGKGSRQKKSPPSLAVIISTVGIILLVFVTCISGYICYMKRKTGRRQDRRESKKRNQEFQLYDTEKRIKNFIDSGDFGDDDKKSIDVPIFDFESILAATDNFSKENKLGQGGFGPVYKGMFPGGLQIAVKRLSKRSGQGLEELKNEVVLIAKLQHRNLVRLLGYCIKSDEKILLYEYMPNKSLDVFIFDSTLSTLLDWKKRFNIILGIGRGLLYLHQDSRLRIIHRDLKTSNILLDQEMNPKISDFGLARIVVGKETESNTKTVVGTYGYMAPEYALDGLFSIKSDVFSFGVIVLEIISGKRNTGFFKSYQAFSLLAHAWSSWKEEKVFDLLDRALLESCDEGEVMRCVSVGLLCVQEDPRDRPTMENVLFMLSNETTLPNPKEPAFIAKSNSATSSSGKPETPSIHEISVSLDEPR